MKMKKKVIFSILALIIIIMVILNPSRTDFDKWMYENYNIKYSNEHWEKNGAEVFYINSHEREMGIFMTIEQVFQDKEGKTITIRALGIFNQIFPMEDSKLWRLIN